MASLVSSHSGRAVLCVGLRSLACRDCGFESLRGVKFVVNFVCQAIEVCAKGQSLAQRCPVERVCVCVFVCVYVCLHY
jgi:hypothetical protein